MIYRKNKKVIELLPDKLEEDEEIWHYYHHLVAPYSISSTTRKGRTGKGQDYKIAKGFVKTFDGNGENNFKTALKYIEELIELYKNMRTQEINQIMLRRHFTTGKAIEERKTTTFFSPNEYPILVDNFDLRDLERVSLGKNRKGIAKHSYTI